MKPDATTAAIDLPDALARFEELAAALEGRRPVVFLDYDGTLTPIVERPEAAVLDAAMRRALERLAERLPVVVVSGRGREDVARRVGLPGLTYAGGHGFDLAGAADGLEGPPEVAAGRRARPAVAAATRELEAALAGVPGAQVEPKGFTVAVHHRRVAPERVAEVEAAVDRVVAAHPELAKAHGKKVFEVRPAIAWDKGRAVLWLLGALGLDGPAALPLYLGDDTTDEDAFRALAGRPGGGVGILVSETPRPTAARYRLADPEEVRELLARLAGRPGPGEASRPSEELR